MTVANCQSHASLSPHWSVSSWSRHRACESAGSVFLSLAWRLTPENPIVSSQAGTIELDDTDVYMSSHEQRFRLFSSVEYEGQLYMTPQNFIESVTMSEPKSEHQKLGALIRWALPVPLEFLACFSVLSCL